VHFESVDLSTWCSVKCQIRFGKFTWSRELHTRFALSATKIVAEADSFNGQTR